MAAAHTHTHTHTHTQFNDRFQAKRQRGLCTGFLLILEMGSEEEEEFIYHK